MIYVYKCRKCGDTLERVEKANQPHTMTGFCPQCGAKDSFKRVLFPTGPPQVVYRGNPRGFATKTAQQEKRYQEAVAIADGAYSQPSENPISKNDDFWEASSDFDAHKPQRYGDPAVMSSIANAPTT